MPASLLTPIGFPSGMPASGSPLIVMLPLVTPGKVLFVDDSATIHRDVPSYGTLDHPFATLAYALTQCTAAKADTVICGPGHSQTVAAAMALTTKALVTVVMLKFGVAFTMGSVASTLFTMGMEQLISGAPKLPPATTRQTIFTVVGGLIRIVALYGVVTTVIANTATNLLFSSTATGLSAVNLSATGTNIAAAAVGTVLSITGTLANATVLSANQTHVAQATAVEVGPGVVEVVTDASPATGAIQYYMAYRAMGPGAYAVAA